MIINKIKNYEEISKKYADIIGSVVVLKQDALFGLATCSTSVGDIRSSLRILVVSVYSFLVLAEMLISDSMSHVMSA